MKKNLNLPGITSRVIGFSILLGIIEVVGFFVGMYALVYLGWFYLAGAVIISILLICWAFGKKYDDLENKNNISNNEVKKIDNTNSLTNDLENKEINSYMPKEKKKCPNCGRYMVGYPAISRKDNKTEICSTCGLLEALDAYKKRG